MKKLTLILLAAVALLASCTQQKEAFPIYVWQGINEKTDMDQLQEQMHFWKSQGVVGVCLENGDPAVVAKAAARAHAEGLEYRKLGGKENAGKKQQDGSRRLTVCVLSEKCLGQQGGQSRESQDEEYKYGEFPEKRGPRKEAQKNLAPEKTEYVITQVP